MSSPIYGGTVVQYSSSFLVIGGYNLDTKEYVDTILEYNTDEEKFKQIGALPQGGRLYITALMVDADIFPECE